jgi:hypothetical protein
LKVNILQQNFRKVVYEKINNQTGLIFYSQTGYLHSHLGDSERCVKARKGITGVAI